MAMCRDGSTEAFSELVRRRTPELFRFFRLLKAGRHDAEDWTQETFLRVYAYRSRFRELLPGGFRILLYRIARNVRADALRRTQRRVVCVPGDLTDLPISSADEIPQGVESALDIEYALSTLEEKHRAVVVFTIFQGLSYTEAAEVLGIPLGTVKSRMLFAVARLKEALGVDAAL